MVRHSLTRVRHSVGGRESPRSPTAETPPDLREHGTRDTRDRLGKGPGATYHQHVAIIFLVFLSLALVALIGVAFILLLQRVIEWVVDRVEARSTLRSAGVTVPSRDDYHPAA